MLEVSYNNFVFVLHIVYLFQRKNSNQRIIRLLGRLISMNNNERKRLPVNIEIITCLFDYYMEVTVKLIHETSKKKYKYKVRKEK